MRIQIIVGDVTGAQLPDVAEALGRAEVETGGAGRFTVHSRWLENDTHWATQVLDALDKYTNRDRERMEQLCQQRYRGIGWTDADLAEIAAYREGSADASLPNQRDWMLRRIDEADKREVTCG